MIIRPIKDQDYSYMYDFTQKAFTTAFVSSGDEQNYASNVRNSQEYIKELEYVAEEDGKIVGDVVLSKFKAKLNAKALLLNIVCVELDYRNMGLGQSIISVALTKARELGYEAVFVAGNPKFYNRMGFKQTIEFGLFNSNHYDDQFILCKELKKGALENDNGTFDFII